MRRAPEPELAAQPPPPQRPAAPVVIEIPRRPGAPPVALLGVEPLRAPLLGDELSRLHKLGARFLATRTDLPLDVVPPEEVAQVAALAKDHRYVEDGPQCGVGPSLPEVASRRWPQAAVATMWADCGSTPCRLLLEVVRDGQRIALYNAPVADPALLPQWEEAAQVLAPDPLAQLPVMPALNPETFDPSALVQVISVQPKGTWSRAPQAQDFTPRLDAFNACHVKGRLTRGDDVLVLSYGATGAAKICEGHSRAAQSEEVLACFCDAAKGVRFAPGEEGRRVVLALRDPLDLSAPSRDGTPITTRISGFRSTSPSITEEALWPSRPWLSLCYGTTRLRDEVSFPVKFQVDPTGHVAAADIAGIAKKAHLIGPCIDGYLRFIAFPCTAAGATVEFTVHLSLQSAGQNRPTSAAPLPVGTTLTSAEGAVAPGSILGWNSSGTPSPNALPTAPPTSTSIR